MFQARRRQTWQPVALSTRFERDVLCAFVPQGGQRCAVTGRPFDVAESGRQSDVVRGALGLAHKATWYGGRRATQVTTLTEYKSAVLVAVLEPGSTDELLAHIGGGANGGNAVGSVALRRVSGVLYGSFRDGSGTTYDSPGYTPASGTTPIKCVVEWVAGVGISLAVDGVDVGTTAVTATTAFRVMQFLEDARIVGNLHYLTAWLGPSWIGQRVALSANPWQIFRARRQPMSFGAATSALPTLSAATYVPGSITSTGFRPRVTAT